MNTKRSLRLVQSPSFACWTLAIAVCGVLLPAFASAQILSIHYPEPSTNGALHYNRAMLELSMIPYEKREVLAKPIWEAFGDMSKDQIDKIVTQLVYDGRHVIRAALHGANQGHAEFGIDYSDYGHGAVLPHAQPMLRVGRLITLAGIQAQIKGEWEKAGTLFFQGLRLARHMTSQPSLVETLVGVEILENNYYALAFWASKCPDVKLVKQAFFRFEISSQIMVHPVRTMAYEASIIRRQVERLKGAFPDGGWSEMLLESLGELAIADSRAEHIAKAKKLAAERGVPESVFQDKASFEAFVSKHGQVHGGFLQAAAVAMALPAKARLERTKSLMETYQPRFAELGDSEPIDIQQIGGFFATHEAEQTMARVALAVAASRTEKGFPESLDAVASYFGGQIPKSPYNGSKLEYALLNQGKDFVVSVHELEAGGVTLPRIDFSSLRE